jgi:TonB family protein
VITPADFIVRPNGADFGDFYPDRALARNKQGRVLVRCSVNAAGRLVSCGVLEEEPAGWGFGNASRRLAEQKFVVRPQTVNGQPTDGGTITFPIRWRLPQG